MLSDGSHQREHRFYNRIVSLPFLDVHVSAGICGHHFWQDTSCRGSPVGQNRRLFPDVCYILLCKIFILLLAHTFNPCSQEAEAGSRPARVTYPASENEAKHHQQKLNKCVSASYTPSGGHPLVFSLPWVTFLENSLHLF